MHEFRLNCEAVHSVPTNCTFSCLPLSWSPVFFFFSSSFLSFLQALSDMASVINVLGGGINHSARGEEAEYATWSHARKHKQDVSVLLQRRRRLRARYITIRKSLFMLFAQMERFLSVDFFFIRNLTFFSFFFFAQQIESLNFSPFKKKRLKLKHIIASVKLII